MPADYAAWVAARRALAIPGYASYADVGLDGPWTTPYHIAARAPDGPVLLTYNFLDAPSALRHREDLLRTGFLPTMPFNRVLTLALNAIGWRRQDLYVTHAFHLLPASRSALVPMGDIEISFDQVGRHELKGRKVIALGHIAGAMCARHGIAATVTPHPSARGTSFADRARTLASALAAEV